MSRALTDKDSSGLRRLPLTPAVHSLLFPTPRIRLSLFSATCALFHFLNHTYPAHFPQVAHSSAKNRGYTPAWSYQASSFLFALTRHSPALSLTEGFTLSVAEGFTLSAGEGPLPLSPLFPLHANISLVCLLFPLLTQKRGSVPPRKNVGAPTFLIFPLIFRTFLPRAYAKGLAQSAVRRVAGHWFCYSMERPAFLRHRSQRSANSCRKVPHP